MADPAYGVIVGHDPGADSRIVGPAGRAGVERHSHHPGLSSGYAPARAPFRASARQDGRAAEDGRPCAAPTSGRRRADSAVLRSALRDWMEFSRNVFRGTWFVFRDLDRVFTNNETRITNHDVTGHAPVDMTSPYLALYRYRLTIYRISSVSGAAITLYPYKK